MGKDVKGVFLCIPLLLPPPQEIFIPLFHQIPGEISEQGTRYF
jgi:hypothetical protein